MGNDLERGGRRKALMRLSFLAAAATLALSACTTIEGTNAMVDPVTFEREVMRPTLVGVGLVPREERDPLTGERPELVIPAPGTTPPPPSQSTAMIPQDSSQPIVVR